MAGHSKWANIQHRKGVQDARRGKLFTKLIREITVSARMSGVDPASNPRLRAAIDSALSANMSKDTVERAIKRGSGDTEGESLDEVRYEGYGPGGVAVIVDCMTNNRNRTAADVRHCFSKCGGNLGADGSVGFLFTRCGVIALPPGLAEDRVMEIAIEAGASDVLPADDGSIEVITTPEDFPRVSAALAAAGMTSDSAEVTLRASTTTSLDLEQAQKMVKMLEMLEDLDDVQKVYSNADISESILARL